MRSSVSQLQSVALSATTPGVTIPLNTDTFAVDVQVSATFAAMAATSGVQLTVTESKDGGSTFVAPPNGGTVKVVPGAINTIASGLIRVTKQNNTPLTHVKFTVTNLDATNAGIVAVEVSQQHDNDL